MVNGILHRVRTGVPWRDLPERFGRWKTVGNRHRRWSGDGTWEAIVDQLRVGADADEGEAWAVAVDSTAVRAHQHAAGARREPPGDIDPERLAPAALGAPGHTGGWSKDKNPADGGDKPPDTTPPKDREALGRSRGGLTSKTTWPPTPTAGCWPG